MASRLQDVIQRGLRVDQPLATDVAEGTLYFVTDELVTERSNGIIWEVYSGSGSGSGSIGLTGIPGIDGINGIDGLDGIQGINGLNGVDGISGIDGRNGILGLDGLDGIEGFPGIQGLQGIQGIPGIDGIDGLPFSTIITTSGTGATNDWQPGIDGNTLILWNGASDVIISGMDDGIVGQTITIKNITTTKVMYFIHQSGLSSAGNKFKNCVTSGSTPVASGGSISYVYDSTDWQIIQHTQGKWIIVPYTVGDFTTTSGTWTVDAGNLTDLKYLLQGCLLYIQLTVVTTTTNVVGNEVDILIPGGFIATSNTITTSFVQVNGVSGIGFCLVVTSGTQLRCFKSDFSAWGTGVNNNAVQVIFPIPV